MKRAAWVYSSIILGLACAQKTAQVGAPEPLSAPAPAPPGHLSVHERIAWWEDLSVSLGAGDRSEAMLNLGDLYIEAGDAHNARIAYRQALQGPLARREEGRAEAGIGRSYLLEQLPELARSHLQAADRVLEGPEREENRVLLRYSEEGSVDTADPILLARLEPFLPTDASYNASAWESDPEVHASDFPVFYDVGRSRWGAASIRSNTDPMEAPWRITVHHSAEPLQSRSLEASMAAARAIQKDHQNVNRWADVGYHFLIDRAGRILEGRPLQYQGSHSFRDNNRGNIGVCLLGNFASHPEDGAIYAQAQAPTAEQMSALEGLVSSLRSHYGMATRNLFFHREFRSTKCPGPYLESWVKRNR